ncbi:MAG TPA: heavy-metal-associated domain-containing protein [Kofleriaceae bacterium]|nr:heavy-metal-associated domain-containing protein [Kofleriaceae bacterium]
MRLLAFVGIVWMAAACQKADSVKASAADTQHARPAPGAIAPSPDPDRTMPAPTAEKTTAAPSSCGGSCGGGGSCSGACGDSCGGAGAMPQWAAIGGDATWQPVYVEGMKCGGCAKRIEKALANVDGVLAVKTDVRTKKIEIVTRQGLDAKSLVKPTIDGLGYRVQ